MKILARTYSMTPKKFTVAVFLSALLFLFSLLLRSGNSVNLLFKVTYHDHTHFLLTGTITQHTQAPTNTYSQLDKFSVHTHISRSVKRTGLRARREITANKHNHKINTHKSRKTTLFCNIFLLINICTQ